DYFRAARPGIREPEMVLPLTAHAAFHKAAHYLGVKAAMVPVDPQTFKADADAVERAITPDTILLVASAPCYPYGVIDPVRELGELALRHGLLLHVDACIGGFLLPYFRRLGAPAPDFDFRVPGVTSISMDLHKYAYAAKGASLVLYRSRDLRRHQLFACARWPGYGVLNPTVQSSRTGGALAGAWAALHFIGDNGYLEIARRLLEATRTLVAGIEGIDGLRVLGKPEMSLVAFASEAASVFHIADEMSTRGWYVQVQWAFAGTPENLHLSVTPSSVPHVDALLADLRASVEKAKALKSGDLAAKVRAALAEGGPAGPSADTFAQVAALAGALPIVEGLTAKYAWNDRLWLGLPLLVLAAWHGWVVYALTRPSALAASEAAAALPLAERLMAARRDARARFALFTAAVCLAILIGLYGVLRTFVLDVSFMGAWFPYVMGGAGLTLLVSALSIALASALALAGALGRLSRNPTAYGVSSFYVSLFRGTPLILQIYICYFALPQLGVILPAVAAGVIALGANYGAYMTEVFRAGVEAVGKGQSEAAHALGMTRAQTLRRIVLPQAFRIVIPAVGNEFVAMLKDSALVGAMGVHDMMWRAQTVGRQNCKSLETLLVAGAFYWVLTILFQRAQGRLEARMAKGERR
ncbi:MAG: ABC transporter permease subunit, partial [Planctomycetes bacterium]|nr:ABC transporter permease subunit [Planctomycetota bacterium]